MSGGNVCGKIRFGRSRDFTQHHRITGHRREQGGVVVGFIRTTLGSVQYTEQTSVGSLLKDGVSPFGPGILPDVCPVLDLKKGRVWKQRWTGDGNIEVGVTRGCVTSRH